ncbi:hypothetical protein XELAEV_18007910mg [Xenopus laevis]|uniref:Uncharacterized protein n=1 Tax=Xenopus laevis TaxID=8355 RepID=A0A974E215_XENLA|nr:hypothetical protein XELAEV_18007910mg [Xenopus laevis]
MGQDGAGVDQEQTERMEQDGVGIDREQSQRIVQSGAGVDWIRLRIECNRRLEQITGEDGIAGKGTG